MDLKIKAGKPYPIGATVYEDGVNFSLFSKNAESVRLQLFDHRDDTSPLAVIDLSDSQHKSYYYWHVFIQGIGHGQLYGYVLDGPHNPKAGFHFDKEKLMVDPYAKSIVPAAGYDREAARKPGNNFGKGIKSVVVDSSRFPWKSGRPENLPLAETVIYEMHIAGFTKHPSSKVPDELKGTYKGVIEKIPYIKSLGVTAVEFLPVQAFDPYDAPDSQLTNFWGYSPINFFAPHPGYATTDDPLAAINELRELIDAFHAEGLEVILDVVFNHTAEGDHNGPNLSFRGIENKAYYLLDAQDKQIYRNFSGTGNTVNANHSIVRRLIRDCLRFWVSEMHVDGFRFDLAAVLSRDEDGKPLKYPPLIWEIESDPVLSKTKLIAEAWDAGGLNQMGKFAGDKWAEWNGAFRDDVRRFFRGDQHTVKALASRISGSSDLHNGDMHRDPNRNIHFVTCHDGFTLYDLVSYNKKHNLANGENNRDGSDYNFSWNCGVEGETSDPEILNLRKQQMKNFLSLVFLSQGTPMILMGDEIRRSQHGNNNAYCQDNELSWFDWSKVEEEQDLLEFTRQLIQFTQELKIFKQDTYFSEDWQEHAPFIEWHGVKLFKPDWGENSHSLALTYHLFQAEERLHILINAYHEPLEFELPELEPGKNWYKIFETSIPTAACFNGFFVETANTTPKFKLSEHSVALFMENQH